MKKKIRIAILGSTGSIGESTLKIISKKKDRFIIDTLVANTNYSKIKKQIRIFKPKNFIVTNFKIYNKLKSKNYKHTKMYNSAINYNLKKKLDITVSAVPGINGLPITLNFIKFTKKLLLANKEAIICGWEILNKFLKRYKTNLIPIDSEHFSIQELLKENEKDNIDKIYITASGGPFFQKKINSNIKPKQALNHPKWNMGKKISIDSATMMNKVFELIEARKLFPKYKKKINILIHPQSLVHAIINYKNGLSKFIYHEPNMIIPISNAILNNDVEIRNFIKLDENFSDDVNLKFYKISRKNFPPNDILAKLNKFNSLPIIINGANEVFVELFLKKKIKFSSIIPNIIKVLKNKNFKKYAIQSASNINKIYDIDQWSRKTAIKIADAKWLNLFLQYWCFSQ